MARYSRAQQKKGGWLLPAFLVVVILAALAVGFLALGQYLDPFDGRMAENVSVCGVSLGGMTREEAGQLMEEKWRDITLSLPGMALRLTPEESGLKLDTKALLKQAYAIGRSEEAPGALTLAPYLTLDEMAVRAALDREAEGLAELYIPCSYYLEGEMPDLSETVFQPDTPLPTLVVENAIRGFCLDGDEAWALILESCSAGVFDIDLTGIATALSSEPADAEAILKDITIQPVDAALDPGSKQPIPGSYGVTFQEKVLARRLKEAEPGQTVRMDLKATAPQVSGREVYFQDVLGFCQTPHGENKERNQNLRLACKALNGVVLEPGQTLSYNATLGQRTEEAGYLPAPAYSGTDLINSVGGGVCQVSSTLYLCSLYAELETVERVSHGYPSSYIPVGLDATVNWGAPDLKIKNNSDYPVKIVAEDQNGFVCVWIMGTETRDYYIRMAFSASDDGYARSYVCKYDSFTHELISKEGHLFSSYLTTGISTMGEIGSEEAYMYGNIQERPPCYPTQRTLKAALNYKEPNTKG